MRMRGGDEVGGGCMHMRGVELEYMCKGGCLMMMMQGVDGGRDGEMERKRDGEMEDVLCYLFCREFCMSCIYSKQCVDNRVSKCTIAMAWCVSWQCLGVYMTLTTLVPLVPCGEENMGPTARGALLKAVAHFFPLGEIVGIADNCSKRQHAVEHNVLACVYAGENMCSRRQAA